MTTTKNNQTEKTVSTIKKETTKKPTTKKVETKKELTEDEILENSLLESNKLDLLNFDLDSLNFDSILKNSEKMKSVSEKSEKNKTSISKFELYAFKTTKADRQKIRTNLKKYTLNIYSVIATNDLEQIKTFISEFLKFYKENYKLNDFTLNSLSYNNRDKDTEERINDFLKLFKELISK